MIAESDESGGDLELAYIEIEHQEYEDEDNTEVI